MEHVCFGGFWGLVTALAQYYWGQSLKPPARGLYACSRHGCGAIRASHHVLHRCMPCKRKRQYYYGRRCEVIAKAHDVQEICSC